jgi:hypothetical protein
MRRGFPTPVLQHHPQCNLRCHAPQRHEQSQRRRNKFNGELERRREDYPNDYMAVHVIAFVIAVVFASAVFVVEVFAVDSGFLKLIRHSIPDKKIKKELGEDGRRTWWKTLSGAKMSQR